MSRAEERGPDSGLPSNADTAKTSAQAAKNTAQAAKSGTQATQNLSGATGTGSASGAAATGTSTTTTGTNTAVRDRTTMPSQGVARGTTPTADYRAGRSAGTSAGGAVGGVLAVVAGLLAFLAGLGAVVRRSFYPNLANYAYHLDVRSWGWIMLVLGVLLFAAGACALLGMGWARIAAVGLAVLTAIASFLFLAYSPVWGAILVALSVVAIWGLLRDSVGNNSV